jgi:hypothetical protein
MSSPTLRFVFFRTTVVVVPVVVVVIFGSVVVEGEVVSPGNVVVVVSAALVVGVFGLKFGTTEPFGVLVIDDVFGMVDGAAGGGFVGDGDFSNAGGSVFPAAVGV